ncbi:MAG: RecQ family ATP-dependent DNA helicase [Phycisphaerales bacterium]
MSSPSPLSHAEFLTKYWGFDSLRPLQARAVECGITRRDSLVVMPTGGGKSLCFQLPPLVTSSLTVVVSPLIALMKDQVDGLVMAGYPAACLNSHTSPDDARAIEHCAEDGELRLLYVAPERLFTSRFMSWLAALAPASFAIDEAHCISAWGHDFRPEYRRLSELRSRFPSASLHAFTATATPRVQRDIIDQLALRAPEILVGVFDRPNLTYRVVPRTDPLTQVREAIARHPTSATIVYCISRKETEQLAASLRLVKINARAYHAGLTPAERRKVQDDFALEKLNVVVATVAFGMGIDRSDVRCVVHTAHPKSVEAYQQETGRAGRDGLPAECLLLYSGADTARWINLIERSASESEIDVPREWVEHQVEHVRAMQRFCQSTRCRHQVLSEYFGQDYVPPTARDAGEERRSRPHEFGCGACDACLGELELDPESLVTAQKIVSCVARIAAANPFPSRPLEFGAAHIAGVLTGSRTRAILERKHDELSTHGILKDLDRSLISSYINQLVDSGALARSPGTFPTISLGEHAREVLRGERDPKLRRAASAAAMAKTKASKGSADGDLDPLSAELFEALRTLRRALAQERSVPAYMIFGDRTLRAMAARRPVTRAALRATPGVGDQKADEFAARFIEEISRFCTQKGITGERSGAGEAAQRGAEEPGAPHPAPARRPASRVLLDSLWERGATVEEACEESRLKPSTVFKYLEEYVQERAAKEAKDGPPLDVSPWVPQRTYDAVIDAAAKTGADRLKPIYEFLGEQVSYDQIRIALTHHRAVHGARA